VKKALLLIVLFVTSVVVVPAAIAQTASQPMYLHFDKPIEIPGQVLQAGTYLFVRVGDDLNEVQVFDAHRTKLLATLFTVPASEPGKISDKLEISIAQGQNGTPALMGWYYPGSTDGQELLYPRSEEKQLSANRRDVSSRSDDSLVSGD
jgi:hypothetical protein